MKQLIRILTAYDGHFTATERIIFSLIAPAAMIAICIVASIFE